MRTFIFTVMFFCLIPFALFSQKIKVDEIDKFTKTRVIETSFEKICSDNSPLGSTGGRLMTNVWAGIKQVKEYNFLRLKWCSNKILSMGEGAHVIFLDNNADTYKFENAEYTISGVGKGSVGMYGSALYGLDIYLTGNISDLVDKELDAFRIYTTDGYIDFKISDKNKNVISDLTKLILSR